MARLRPPCKLPDNQYTFAEYGKFIAWCPQYGTFDHRWLRGEPPFPNWMDDSRAEITVDVIDLDEEEII